jgi:hypothetical protein
VSVSVGSSPIYGYVNYRKKKYYVERVKRFEKSVDCNVIEVYTEDQIKLKARRTCSAALSQEQEQSMSRHNSQQSRLA